MIVEMKKVSFVIVSEEKEAALRRLGELGVVHIETVPQGRGQTLAHLKSQRHRLEAALSTLGKGKRVKGAHQEGDAQEKVISLADQIVETAKDLESKNKEIRALEGERKRTEAWGNFDPTEMEIMRSQGVDLRLYEAPLKRREAPPRGTPVFLVGRTRRALLLAVVLPKGGRVPSLWEEFPLPQLGLEELDARLEQLTEERQDLVQKLARFECKRPTLARGASSLGEQILFEEMRTGMAQEEELVHFTGYVPFPEIAPLKKEAAKRAWGLLIQRPKIEDPVPSLLKTNTIFRIVKPIFDAMGVVPGYREYDISSYFLLFFGLFFAMIIGDAGYGFLLLFLGGIIHIRQKRASDPVRLLYFLSAATVIWGALTGAWFGSQTLAAMEPFKSLTMPRLALYGALFGENEVDQQSRIMYFCFLIGTIHLSLAHLLGFIREFPSWKALAQLSLLSMVIGCYHLVLLLVFGITPLPPYVSYMIAAGLLGVVLFDKQEAGIGFLKGVARGLGGLFTLFLDSIGILSDIMSYIRLFAVGLASSAIAASFNAMATPLLTGGGVNMIPAVLILLLGHGLNLIMGGLSVIVHGVRLNLLEFSRHLNMGWAGIKYEPFRFRK